MVRRSSKVRDGAARSLRLPVDARCTVRTTVTKPRRRWPALLLALALIGGCSSGPPAASGQPTPGGQPTPSAQPTQGAPPTSPPSPAATDGPAATDFPSPGAEPPPLPEPELTTVDEIAQAMSVPGAGQLVVVSLLDLLGIGLYKADGTPIRTGLETSDDDLFLWEPEARGLAKLVDAQFAEDGWMEFRDFHAVLAEYGYTGSAEELAAEYADLFAAAPDDPIGQLVGYVDADVPITKFSAWLLFVDGFVRNSGAATRQAALAMRAGDARRPVAQLGGPLTMDPNVIVHLMLVAASAQPSVAFDWTSVHEGHGVPGPPVEIKAHVRAVAVTWVSPFTGASLIPLQALTTNGIRVEFEGNRTITRHGSLSGALEVTDANGDAVIGYAPRMEPAGGQGVEVSAVGIVTARVNITDVMTQLYGQPALAAFAPASGIGIGQLLIEWHDEPPLRIDFTNTYNLELPHEIMGTAQTAGHDTISGDLIVDEDDPLRWEGTALGYAEGSFSGELFGQSCSTSWDTQQILHVTGLEEPGSGEMLFMFQPLTDPLGDMGSARCRTSRPPSPEGIIWAPFNDLAVTDPTIGLRFNVAIPRPGFLETDYPVPLQGTGVTGYANWHVRIEFVTP